MALRCGKLERNRKSFDPSSSVRKGRERTSDLNLASWTWSDTDKSAEAAQLVSAPRAKDRTDASGKEIFWNVDKRQKKEKERKKGNGLT